MFFAVAFCDDDLDPRRSKARPSPNSPFVGNDIRYTQEQLNQFEIDGIDTTGMLLSKPDSKGTLVRYN